MRNKRAASNFRQQDRPGGEVEGAPACAGERDSERVNLRPHHFRPARLLMVAISRSVATVSTTFGAIRIGRTLNYVLAALALVGLAMASSPATSAGGLLTRTDLIYGSEVGAWNTNGGVAVQEPVATKIRAANVRIIRYAAYDCFTGMTCGRDNHPGTIRPTDFNAAIKGITQTDNALLWLKMVPISRDTIGNGINGTLFCPPWTGAADQNLPMYKAVVKQAWTAGYRGPLVLESNNEMEFSCYKYWQSQGASISGGGSVGVSKRIGEHYAATMPKLKAYALSLGFPEVVVGGYIGVAGGPEWGQACTADSSKPFDYSCGYSSRWMTEFNTAVKKAGVVPPDFESIHAYPHGPDFSSSPGYEFDDKKVYAFYRNWLVQSRKITNNIWGSEGNNIRFSISEWNAGSSNTTGTWSGWTTPNRPEQFYGGWYNMLRGDGVTTGTGTAYWNSNLFLIAGNSDTGTGRFYNWVRKDGTVPSWYQTIKDFMTGVR